MDRYSRIRPLASSPRSAVVDIAAAAHGENGHDFRCVVHRVHDAVAANAYTILVIAPLQLRASRRARLISEPNDVVIDSHLVRSVEPSHGPSRRAPNIDSVGHSPLVHGEFFAELGVRRHRIAVGLAFISEPAVDPVVDEVDVSTDLLRGMGQGRPELRSNFRKVRISSSLKIFRRRARHDAQHRFERLDVSFGIPHRGALGRHRFNIKPHHAVDQPPDHAVRLCRGHRQGSGHRSEDLTGELCDDGVHLNNVGPMGLKGNSHPEVATHMPSVRRPSVITPKHPKNAIAHLGTSSNAPYRRPMPCHGHLERAGHERAALTVSVRDDSAESRMAAQPQRASQAPIVSTDSLPPMRIDFGPAIVMSTSPLPIGSRITYPSAVSSSGALFPRRSPKMIVALPLAKSNCQPMRASSAQYRPDRGEAPSGFVHSQYPIATIGMRTARPTIERRLPFRLKSIAGFAGGSSRAGTGGTITGGRLRTLLGSKNEAPATFAASTGGSNESELDAGRQ